MAAVIFPDVELLLTRHLTAALDGIYVCTSLPPDDELRGLLPAVRVMRSGGGWTIRKQLDDAVIDVDVWHTQLQPLNDLIARLRAEIEDMRGLYDAALGVAITETTEVAGPRRLPEDDPLLIRAGFTVSLLSRPA